MNLDYLGELAALGTSLCFTAGSVFFTQASRLVGALVLNRTRLLMALLLLALSHWVLYASPFPTQAGVEHWFWLGLSGIIGLALGDVLLFQGFAALGPRLTMLLMSLSPLLTALLAWLFLGEKLGAGQVLGIAITLGGIAWVVLEQNSQPGDQSRTQSYRRGLAAGLGAAACQSVGLVLARQGMAGDFPAVSGNFIRMASASLALWGITALHGQVRITIKALETYPKAIGLAFLGALAGPFLGVSLSLFAIQHAEMGVASTLMALPPVLLLPVSFVIYRERFGWQAIAGTLVAMAGITLLFLV